MTSALVPYFAEGLALILLAFAPLAFGAVEPWSLFAVQCLIFLLLVLAVRLPYSRDRKGPNPMRLGLLCLGGLVLVQCFFGRAADGPSSLLPHSDFTYATQQGGLLIASYAALIYALERVWSTPRHIIRAASFLLILGAIIAVIGIAQRGQGNTLYYGIRTVRAGYPFGPFPNPNHGAAFLTLTFLVGIGLFFHVARELKNHLRAHIRTDQYSKLILISFSLALIAAGLISTRSKGAFLALSCGLWLGIFLSTFSGRKSRYTLLARIGLVLSALGSLLVFYFSARSTDGILRQIQFWFPIRISLYTSGFLMFSDSPFFGHGFGVFEDIFQAYKAPYLQTYLWNGITTGNYAAHLHSDWLELAAETGLAGLIALGLPFTALFTRMMKQISRSPETPDAAIRVWSMAALSSFIVHSAVDFPARIPAISILAIALAVLAGKSNRELTRSEKSASSPLFLRSVLSVAAGTAVVLASRPAIAAYYVKRAEFAAKADKIRFLQRAIDIDPSPKHHIQTAKIYETLAMGDRLNFSDFMLKALRHSETALFLSPSNRTYMHVHGKILHILGRPEDGLHYLLQASTRR